MKHWTAILIVVGGLVFQERAKGENVMPFNNPPLAALVGAKILKSHSIEQDCKREFGIVAEQRDFKVTATLLTEDVDGRVVWRADFTYDGEDPSSSLVNRVVCWSEEGALSLEIAFGQRIPAL